MLKSSIQDMGCRYLYVHQICLQNNFLQLISSVYKYRNYE